MKGIISLVLFSVLVSCENQPATVYLELPVIRVSQIYAHNTVREFLSKDSEDQDKMAAQYEKKARAVSEENPDKAIFFIKRAITVEPTLDRYLFLSGLLDKTRRYKERQHLLTLLTETSSYEKNGQFVSDYVFGPPDEDLYYEYLVTRVAVDGVVYSYYVNTARELGFDVTDLRERLLKDERLRLDPASLAYKNISIQFMSPEELDALKQNPDVFLDMLQTINDTASVFEIGLKENADFRYSHEEEWDGEEMDVSMLYENFLYEKKQDPNAWFTFNLKRKVKLADSLYALVYAIDSSERACPREMRHVYHRLITCDLRGNIIDQAIVAWQSANEIATLSYNKAAFTVTRHQRNWKKPYVKQDFDNFIVSVVKQQSEDFFIDASGNIQAASGALEE